MALAEQVLDLLHLTRRDIHQQHHRAASRLPATKVVSMTATATTIRRDGSSWPTVSAALPVPLEQASAFGILEADADGRVCGFHEKPASPRPLPGDRARAYASMGNYVFSAACLMRTLRGAHRCGETDFGNHVLPRLLRTGQMFAYDFPSNEVPGLNGYEEPAYWRDVGTVDAYFEAHHDTLGSEPRLDLFNPAWPILSSSYQGPVARVVGGEVDNCLLGAATLIQRARVRNCIVRREAVVEEAADLKDCIIMDYVRIGRGARLRRAIVDRHNRIAAGSDIGLDPGEDRRRYTVSLSGVVVVPRGRPTFYPRGTRRPGSRYGE